jgi:hypothetical protein
MEWLRTGFMSSSINNSWRAPSNRRLRQLVDSLEAKQLAREAIFGNMALSHQVIY